MARGSGTHASGAVEQALKDGRLKSPLLFCGREEYLIRWAVERIIENYISEAARVFDYAELDGFEIESAREVINAAETMPMMSEKRVIRVRSISSKCADMQQLVGYMADVPESSILVFTQSGRDDGGKALADAISKSGAIYDFKQLDKVQLDSFIRKRLRSAGADFEHDSVSALMELSGYYDRESDYTLDNLVRDIDKTVSHSSGRVSVNDIMETVVGSAERNAFAFTDALAAGDKNGALNILTNMLSYGANVFNVLGIICSQFEVMYLISEAKERGSVSFLEKELKLNSYRIRLLSKPALRYTSAQLRRILMEAYKIDRSIKTGEIEQNLALELFVANVC